MSEPTIDTGIAIASEKKPSFLTLKSGAWLLPASLAVLLRLSFLSARPVWYDEAFAILFASKGPSAMLTGTLTPVTGGAADVHPLAYYWLLWAWMQIFGQTILAARLLSVIFGLGCVWLAYRLGKMLFSERTGLLFACLAAVSPFQLHYSHEIRMYSLLAFLLLASTIALWQGVQTGRLRWWALFALTAALAQYTQSLAAFFLLPLAATPLLMRRWKSVLAVALSGGAALLLYLPWLWFLPSQLQKVQSAYWTEPPGVARLFTALLSYVTSLPLQGASLPVGLFITLACLVFAGYQTVRAWRRRQEDYRKGLWLLYLAIAPLLLLFTVSQWQPVFIERALLPSGLAFILWLGWAFSRTSLPRVVAGIAFALLWSGMILGVILHYTYRGFPYGPFVELTDSLSSRANPEDLILHSNKLSMLPSVLYAPSLQQSYLADPPGSGSDTLALPTQQVLGLIAIPNLDELDAEISPQARIWFIIFQRAIDEYLASGAPEHPHLVWLYAHYDLESIETWGELRVYVFAD